MHEAWHWKNGPFFNCLAIFVFVTAKQAPLESATQLMQTCKTLEIEIPPG